MKDSAPYRSVLLQTFWGILSAAALTIAPHQTFAQHSGGSGHSAEGAGHPSAGSGFGSVPHVSAPVAPVAQPVSPPAGGIGNHPVQVAPRTTITPPASVHPAEPVLDNHVVMPPAVPSSGPRPTIGFPPSTGQQRQSSPHPGSPRFYGQGRQIGQAPPSSAARIARPSTPPLTTNQRGRYTVLQARPPVAPSTALPNFFPPRRPIPPIRGPIHGGFGGFGLGAPFSGLGAPLFGFGEFGLGWGLGFGFGWGPTCGPYWGWGFGCNALPYYSYGYYNSGYSAPPSNGLQPEPAMPSQESGPFSYEYPPPDTSQNSISAEQFEIALYLKDGTVYAVSNYWLAGGKLVYQTNYGGENSIDLDQIDMQKTVDVNASRGVEFTLRPKPLENDQNPPATPSQPPPSEQQLATPDGGQTASPDSPPPRQP